MKPLLLMTAALLPLGGCLGPARPQPAPTGSASATALPTIARHTAGSRRLDGLLTCYVDDRRGIVWLELPAAGAGGAAGQFLYVEGLRAGVGSNPIGLDRGQIGATRVVEWRRLGRRVVLEEQNLRFRARTSDDAERRAVRESFATSILWAGDVVAEAGDGRFLIDVTSWVVRDAHGVARTLEGTGQGAFELDAERSVVDTAAVLVFPDNLEFEALLTFEASAPGGDVRATAPTAEALTVVQHHALIRLPDARYRPRRFDPRAPSFATSFRDYGAALDAPLDVKWINRHRLEKADPGAARSPAVEPIVYYVDRGTPEPVRSALVEGASWWRAAFEAAGFVDAFRVELLPPDAHPLDVRYNVIQWVHRSTRGWSYGRTVSDPRTGEIIKGHVSLGSLRVRQDRLLFEGLVGTAATGTGAPDDPVELALARIRQLAAHEVGHTLGFTHNFAASTYGGRASVMDYPAPLIGITADNRLDFGSAYAEGVGAWDVFAVRYAYTQFPAGADEDAELARLIAQALERRMLFISDDDARPAGAAHPQASLWDNGADAVAGLRHAMQVRRIALDGFADDRIAAGRPRALLHEVFVPVYLHHRYQLDAAVKVIGGLDYSYAVRGDGQGGPHTLDGTWQREAVVAVLQTLDPRELDIPERVLQLLQPRPFGYGAHRELFDSGTAPAFDALGAARSMADLAVAGVLQRERCARLVAFHARDETLPGLEEVIDDLTACAFKDRKLVGQRLELSHVVQDVVVARLIELSADPQVPAEVRSRVDARLADLAGRLEGEMLAHVPAVQRDHWRRVITRHLDRPQLATSPPPLPAAAPPGSPIGMAGRCDDGR